MSWIKAVNPKINFHPHIETTHKNQYTNKIPLEVEHIDGNYKNNVEENLTLLCPNCHALTATYKGANLNKGRKSRSKYKI